MNVDIDCSISVVAWPEFDLSAEQLRRDGRVRIPNFLSHGIEYLYNFARSNDEWIQVINTEDGVLEIDLDEWENFDIQKKSKIKSDMYQRASRGFQYSYAAVAVPDVKELTEEPGPLADFFRFTQQSGTKDLLAKLTGVPDLRFTDGQLTVYNPGDLLTGHDDAVEGKDRVAAFVLGLTPIWRLEWGGLLHFHPQDKEPVLALVPDFNSLDLFTVPRLHSVSQISPSALLPRYALTGWLSR
jgi:SM-20-related protein